ncbi:MAG: hypothetical protein PHV36_00095 [Elusimicrobiales bacterium]|nr:hypothetical protein [Elusimicrobiales bacterium]
MRNAYGINEIGKRSWKASCFRLFALLSLLLHPSFFSLAAHAAITQSINYQGFLLSKITNMPVETPQDIKFIIYNTPVGPATGGMVPFTESRCNVKVSKGRYDVEIGSATPGGIPPALFTDYSALWLEIQVDSDGDCSGTYEAMSPRVRLQASPYAFNSIYASTASIATSTFSVNIIGALPNTTNGAVTISTNLFVMGGISVGDITPGSKLSVKGMVESRGDLPGCADPANYTCGFKFPDGSVQVKAAALTMWDVTGDNLHTINPGNAGIGDTGVGNPLLIPQARLHVSSGTSAATTIGNLLLVTAGSDEIFRVASNGGTGEVHGGSYYGDGTTLTGIVRKAGDTMTGLLTVTSVTATSAQGVTSPKFKLLDNVEISSAPASAYGGIRVSTHIYIAPSSIIYGDGSGLINVTSLPDSTKVLKVGDVMSGPLSGITSLTASSATITGSAFSVSGSTTFSVLNGNTAVGTGTHLARLTVGGGIIASSSVTANGGLFTTTVTATRADFTGQVAALDILASTATFRAWAGPDMNNSYSITTASGIKVTAGVVFSSYGFIGDGSGLWNVSGTDSSRLLRTGDTITGHLLIANSSFTILPSDQNPYAVRVLNPASNDNYLLAVSTGGNMGVMLPNTKLADDLITIVPRYPAAPLEVNRDILISNSDLVNARAQLHLMATAGDNFIHWSDPNFGNLGALGYQGGVPDLVYRAMGSDPLSGGQEVFRIGLAAFSSDPTTWNFGIGTTGSGQAFEKFHVMTNMLVSTNTATQFSSDPTKVNPILYVSTTSGGVSIRTLAQTHALTVNGGINAISSITAEGGYYGNQSGVVTVTGNEIQLEGKTAMGAGSIVMPDSEVYVAEDAGLDFSFAVGNNAFNSYDFAVSAGGRVGIGLNKLVAATPSNSLQVMDSIRIGADGYGDSEAYLYLRPNFGPSYIVWSENVGANFLKGALGFASGSNDLVYKAGATDMGNGYEVFKVAGPSNPSGPGDFASWKFGIGTSNPAEKFHVATNMLIGATGLNSPALFVSTGTGFVGISTGAPQAGLHDASNFLVGATRASAALYVSSITGNVGISTGSPQAKLDVNGVALFRSSLTISGTGLSGTQSAFEVIGSTLVVRYDGKVGIGVPGGPTERLDVAGKVKATGFVASREIKNTVCNAAATCTATCTAGKVVLGGGCSYAVGVDSMTATYPSGDTTWQCDYSGTTGNITAYAICSTLE